MKKLYCETYGEQWVRRRQVRCAMHGQKEDHGNIKDQVGNAIQSSTKLGAPIEVSGDKTIQHIRDTTQAEEC